MTVIAGCAAKVLPPAPSVPRYPEFVYPVIPDVLRIKPAGERVDRGWRFLQSDDLRNADREFAMAMKQTPDLYPAQTGAGYVDVARRDYEKAIVRFNAALVQAPKYVPALVGRGQAFLALERMDDALATFEAALLVDPSLADVRQRVDVLRFRTAQEVVEQARTAARAGRLDDARAAYQRALQVSPDSAFLHRELGVVERRRGDTPSALAALRRAVALDPVDATSLVQIGELLEQRLEFADAEAAYRSAAQIEPGEAIDARIAGLAEKARLAKLPPEFHAIRDSPQITRAELAALIGIRLEHVLKDAEPRQIVVTDVRNHWAAPWITQVATAGVLEPFPNHTFQPRARLRRGDLAAAASRLALLAASDNPKRREAWTTARPKITDMSPGHLGYPAVAVAVAAGVVPLLEGDRFDVSRPVSGAEAIDVIDRVLALSRDAR